jgi:hypothetical protein
VGRIQNRCLPIYTFVNKYICPQKEIKQLILDKKIHGMLFRNADGKLVEINRLKYPNDELYYKEVQRTITYLKMCKKQAQPSLLSN